MTPDPLVVIGLGQDGPGGLSEQALDHVHRAGLVAGGKRHLASFPDLTAERIVIDADLDRVMDRLKDSHQRQKTVVLASGDPLFYGIGRRLLEEFPRDELVFLPQVSSLQLAFARLKQTWHDACVVSVHGRPMEELLPPLASVHPKIAILTDDVNDPQAIHSFLEERGWDGLYAMWVCEDLGGPKERVRPWMRGNEWSNLNVVVLLRNALVDPRPDTPLLGIPDRELRHRVIGNAAGLITKREVRLVDLAYLELRPGDVFWDVGAGSGAVATEAARLCSSIRVFAVERNSEAHPDIQENIARFRLSNVQLIAGEAPEVLSGLPVPDAVFIGGHGGRLVDILDTVTKRLKPGGRIVINCIALESLSLAWNWLCEHGFAPEVTSLQLSHSRPLGSVHCLEPDKLLFILRTLRP